MGNQTRRSAESGYDQDVNTDLEQTTNQVAPPTEIYNKTIAGPEGFIADESIQNLRAAQQQTTSKYMGSVRYQKLMA